MFNKKITVVLAAVTAVLTLAACGAQDVSTPASVSTIQSASSTQTTESKGKESASVAQDKSDPANSEKTAASSAGKSAPSGSTKASDNKTAASKTTGGETPAGTQTNTGKTGTNQTDTGKTGTSTDSKIPAATPAPGSNAGTGHNPNAGGAAGQGKDYVIPGDGSWAVDGGNATLDEGAVPPPPVTNPDDNIGTGHNPNEGGAIGGGNTTVPGDGSWAVDGGDATLDDEVIPPPPVTNPDDNIGTGHNPNEGGAIGGGNTTIPGDGSWAVDGGNATPGDQVIPPEPIA